MYKNRVVGLGLCFCLCTTSSLAQTKQPGVEQVLSVVELARQAHALHGSLVVVEGRIASVCPEEGCFIDVLPSEGSGPGVMVVARNVAFKFPLDCVGKNIRVHGTFINKIYPASRMRHWHKHGWRANNKTLPEFASVLRIEADSYELTPAAPSKSVQADPLVDYGSFTIDIDHTDFEAARMNSGKICVEPGKTSPEQHTRGYQSLVFAVDNAIDFADLLNSSCNTRLQAGQAQYVPTDSRYTVSNPGKSKACFLWVSTIPNP